MNFPSRVSLVTPVYGAWDCLQRCWESLAADLRPGIEWILVNNGSPQPPPEPLRCALVGSSWARWIESPVNLGFPRACNLGARAATGHIVVFLASDVVVAPGGLSRLLAHFGAKRVGAVGPRSNRIVGTQGLERVPYDEETLEGFQAYAAERAACHEGRATPVGRLSGFCLAVKREVLERIGGFDPAFGVGNFEDDDFCLRARLAGFELLQAEDVVVHHFGGRSFAAAGVDRQAAIREAWAVFKRKWRLPPERPLEGGYDDAELLQGDFDPARHFVALDLPSIWQPLRAAAEEALGRGERARAWALFSALADLDPDDDDAAMFAAALALERGDEAGAAASALGVLQRRPFHPAAANLLGVACLDSGRAGLARRVFARVLERAPKFATAKKNLELARRAHDGAAADVAEFPESGVRAWCREHPPVLGVCVVVRCDVREACALFEAAGSAHAKRIAVDATRNGDLARRLPEAQVVRVSPAASDDEAWDAGRRGARTDWLLMLAEGERLSTEGPLPWNRWLARRGVLAYALEIETPGAGVHREVRLFRNAPDVRHDPRCEESLELLARRWSLRIASLPLRVRRAGGEVPRLPAGRPLSAFETARAACERGDWEACLEALARVAPPASRARAEAIATIRARCLVRLERHGDTRQALATHHEAWGPTANTRFFEALALRALGVVDGALAAAEDAARRLAEPSFEPPLPELVRGDLEALCGSLRLETGDLEGASRDFAAARAKTPDHLDATMGQLAVRLAHGEADVVGELGPVLERHAHVPRAWLYAAALLGCVPRDEEAIETWVAGARTRLEDADRRRMGLAVLRGGHARAARTAWAGCEPLDAPSRAAWLAAALAVGAADEVDAHAHSAGVEETLDWFRQWWAAGAYAALDCALCTLGACAERLRELAQSTAVWLERIGQLEAAAQLRGEVRPTPA